MLQSQQEGQSNAQSAALMAVQDSTETCIKELTDRQLAIAGQFQEELMATQSAISEQFMAMQAQAGEQIKTPVTEKLFNALREVQYTYTSDPAAGRGANGADISAEIKQSLERSVKMIIELISVAVDRNAQTNEEIKTEIENRGSVSEYDGDENYD
ncbi:hypothetical protein PRNP1_014453 [Phytophthora ramorum]